MDGVDKFLKLVLKIYQKYIKIMDPNYMWKKALMTIQEMFIDHRGYKSLAIHPENHHVAFCNLTEANNDTIPEMVVFYCSKEKMNIDALKEVIAVLESYRIKKCFLVYKNVITSSAKKALAHIFQYEFEIWNLKELQYNITKHFLYSPHIKISPSEYKKHFHKMETLQELPKISKSDPVSRFFNFQRNDILQIQRKDGTLAYRIVK